METPSQLFAFEGWNWLQLRKLASFPTIEAELRNPQLAEMTPNVANNVKTLFNSTITPTLEPTINTEPNDPNHTEKTPKITSKVSTLLNPNRTSSMKQAQEKTSLIAKSPDKTSASQLLEGLEAVLGIKWGRIKFSNQSHLCDWSQSYPFHIREVNSAWWPTVPPTPSPS